MKTLWTLLCGILAVLILSFAAAPAQADGPSCADLKVCFWTHTDFTGDKYSYNALEADGVTFRIDSIGSHESIRSVKNRLPGNRKAAFLDSGYQRLGCIDPGENEDNVPLQAEYIRIGTVNDHC